MAYPLASGRRINSLVSSAYTSISAAVISGKLLLGLTPIFKQRYFLLILLVVLLAQQNYL